MPSSSVHTFTDPSEYAKAIGPWPIDLTVTQPGNFTAKYTSIDLHSLWLQRFSEALARTSHVDAQGGRAVIGFLTEPGASVFRNGVEMEMNTVSRFPAHNGFYQHTSGPCAMGRMSFPLEELADLGATVAGCDLAPPTDDMTVRPPPDAVARLQRLNNAAEKLAENAPAFLEHPEAARSLEQALIEALMECLAGGEIHENRSAHRQHAAIMRRFHRVIEEHIDQPLYVPQLCRKVGASIRTLNACCHEHLGMGPKRYLLLRRMNLVRQALGESTPADTTVTEIATRYGFWQFGRFAVEYKALFGESPSATLSRPPMQSKVPLI